MGCGAPPRFFFFVDFFYIRNICFERYSALVVLSTAPGSSLPSTKAKPREVVCACFLSPFGLSATATDRGPGCDALESQQHRIHPSMPIKSTFPTRLLRHGSWRRGSSDDDQRSSTETVSSVAPSSGPGAQTDRLSSCVRKGADTYTKGSSAAACALCEALVELDHLVHKGGSKELSSLVSVYDRVARGVLLCCEHPAEGAGGGGCARSVETLTQHVENAKKVAATLCVKRRLARLSTSKQQLERELRNLTDELHMFATHHTPELATDESGYVSITVFVCVPLSCSCLRLARVCPSYTAAAAASSTFGGIDKVSNFHTSQSTNYNYRGFV